jgi:hypothetical protein
MPTSRSGRDIITTSWNWRDKPTWYITLLAGDFDDGLEYILTDEDDNAIFVYDSTGYPVIGTIWAWRDII